MAALGSSYHSNALVLSIYKLVDVSYGLIVANEILLFKILLVLVLHEVKVTLYQIQRGGLCFARWDWSLSDCTWSWILEGWSTVTTSRNASGSISSSILMLRFRH